MVPEDAPKTGTEQNERPNPAYAGRRGRRSGRGRRGRGRRAPLETEGRPGVDDDLPPGPPAREEDEAYARSEAARPAAPVEPPFDDDAPSPETNAPYETTNEPEAPPARAASVEPDPEPEYGPADDFDEELPAEREGVEPDRPEAEAEPERRRPPEVPPAARPAYRPPPPERRPAAPEPPRRPFQPAEPASVRKAIEEVGEVLESLRLAIDDLEEVLDTLELAERQKNADEQEIESLRRALRQFQRPRERERDRDRDRDRDREGGPRR